MPPGSVGDEVDAARGRSYAASHAAVARHEHDPIRTVSVSVAEFLFLAMGLVLGVAAGAALVEFIRARPHASREVRVTVARDAIPRRSATLADDAFTAAGPEPARGGPADRRLGEEPPPIGTPDRRTPVHAMAPATRAPAALVVAGSPTAHRGLLASASRPALMRPAEQVAVPVHSEVDPMLSALRASAAAAATAAMASAPRDASPGPGIALAPTMAAVASDASASGGGERSGDPGGGDPGDPANGGGSRTGAAKDPTAPCADQRRLADERCELASRARAGATEAEDVHRAAQRAYDDHEARADAAHAAADPRAVRRAKDDAQARFREGRSSALTTDEVEAAARDWLLEINRINAEAREAAAALNREQEAVRALTLDLERLAMEAEAARIGAEMAEAACLSARQALADCEEAVPGPAAPVAPPMRDDGPIVGDDERIPPALGSGKGSPRIFRLLRGDRAAMIELVAAMAGDDPIERRRWQIQLSDLVDAILADSIAASSLEFPADHPFWGPFTLAQDRDIAGALASLGYRFDGLGGWVDGRTPSQRDLSLAVGYSGLDPMRIRHWPTEAEMAELYRDVTVAADEHLAAVAGDLTLGELVTMLGRRADGLAEVWNHWGRLRPLLLEER